MIFKETELKGSFLIEPEMMADERGFFARAWCKNELEKHGLNPRVAQSNISFHFKKGTIRGMHFQAAPYPEVKLFRCIRGLTFHVIVDLRVESPTFRKWFGVELSAENRRSLYVPEGFASGYQALEESSEVFYQVSEFYRPDKERGFRWNDPLFGIEWPLKTKLVISDKDRNWPKWPQ